MLAELSARQTHAADMAAARAPRTPGVMATISAHKIPAAIIMVLLTVLAVVLSLVLTRHSAPNPPGAFFYYG